MNKLDNVKRSQILSMLVEGSSMRSVSRVCDVSINTVAKLLSDAGKACDTFHDEMVRNVQAKRVQCDEIWSFVGAKQKNVATMKTPVEGAGDAWTWTAIEADTKLIIAWSVGGRDADCARDFMLELQERISTRVQLTTDGHKAYLEAVEDVFGDDVDYAQLVKLYGNSSESAKGRYSPAECTGIKKKTITGAPDEKHVSTSYVERQNLNMRMGMRRFTRLTNAFSKKLDGHLSALALYFYHYNWCRSHKSLNKLTPAMASGLTARLYDWNDILDRMDADQPIVKRGPYKKKAKA